MSAPVNINVDEAARQLHEAAAAKKCWQCGCLRSSLQAIEEAFSPAQRGVDLDAAIQLSKSRLKDVKYDCLAAKCASRHSHLYALGVEGDACRKGQ